MTKLTSWMRESIVTDLLKHRFGADALAFAAAKSELASEVYLDIYSEDERAKMAALPTGWLFEGAHVGVQFGDGRNYSNITFDGSICGDIGKVLAAPVEKKTMRLQRQHEHGCAKVYEITHPLSVKYEALKSRQSDLEQQISKARKQAEAAVASASTVNKLVSIWPEIEPFASKFLAEPKAVPALPTSELNALLDLPVSEAA